MNCIYKTNKYKMSSLIISDHTCLYIIFYVAFCFITQKTIIDYSWVLKQLRALYVQLNIYHFYVIIIDMKKNLMKVINTIFSNANHFLCFWHININVLANCKRDFVDKNDWNAFFDSWKTIMCSSSEEEFSKTWREFRQSTAHLIQIVWSTWN
jgi:transposase-like protein